MMNNLPAFGFRDTMVSSTSVVFLCQFTEVSQMMLYIKEIIGFYRTFFDIIG